MTSPALKDLIANIPHNPGVYKYYDEENKIIYIGKAKNLKKRVSSYFNKHHFENHKTKVLVSKIKRIEYVVVETEYDALLLENSLIKQYKPRYNINLKDDKSYPYIKITNERFPRVFPIRNPIDDGSKYFGPYSSVKMMNIMLDLIKELYPLRNCNLNLSEENIKKGKFRLCLEYYIGNCKGPCVGLQSENDYIQNIAQIELLLKGNLNEVKVHLKKQMHEAAKNLAFEDAHKYKMHLDIVEKFQAKSTIVPPTIQDVEVLSVVSDSNKGFVNYLRVTNGIITRARNLEIKKILNETDEDLLLAAFAEVRTLDIKHAPELILPTNLKLKIAGVKITIPQRGDKKMLLDLSIKNAFYYKKERIKMAEILDPEQRMNRIMDTMRDDLRLTEQPRHIECFDNSNFQGTDAVSACVVFKDGKPSKSDYRHFLVKTVVGPNDFATMQEVITRRYKRLLEENQALPQLIIVDGGKGQLSSAVEALKALDLYGKIAVLGIAKRLEELYYPEDPIPLYLDKKSETLKIIQQMRDEAHRFGITHHRNRRSKTSLKSELDGIKGIGDKTKSTLLQYFKSVENIKNAELKEIERQIGLQKAHIVHSFFHS